MFHRYSLYMLGIFLLLAVAYTAPGMPNAWWDDTSAPNSTNGQKIIVERPDNNDPTEHLGRWQVFYKEESTGVFSNSALIDSQTYQINDVADNSKYIIYVVNFNEDIPSPVKTITIGDRTPPTFTSSSPISGATNVPPNTTPIVINWQDMDINLGGVNYGQSRITINTQSWAMNAVGSITPSSNTGYQVNGRWTYTPGGQKYNQSVTVSVRLYDLAGNNMTTPAVFNYRTAMTAPAAPEVTWNAGGPNSRDTQRFTVTRPSTTNAGGVGIDNITHWDIQWRYTDPLSAWTPSNNILIASNGIISGVSDNCDIEVQVRFRGTQG